MLSIRSITWAFISFSYQVHNEREMDRVLGIEGIELVGINNRDLGKVFYTSEKTDQYEPFCLLKFIVWLDKTQAAECRE